MTTTPPTSVGQLLAMSPEARAERIRALSPEVRMKLAHLASIGATSAASKALEHLDAGRSGILRKRWAIERLEYAREHAHLAAHLTSEVTPIPEDTPPRSLYNDAIPTPDHLTHDPTSGDLNWPRRDPK